MRQAARKRGMRAGALFDRLHGPTLEYQYQIPKKGTKTLSSNRVGRFIIYGAGAIGGVIGGHLALAGTDVVLIGRPEHMNAVRRDGLRLIRPTGPRTVKVGAVTSPAEVGFRADDVVLLTMKGQNTGEAMRDLKAVARDLPIFCAQNGIRNEETVAGFFPRVYGVRVNVGAVYMNTGEVVCRREPPGWLVIGKYPTGTDDLAIAAGDLLRKAGFYVLVSPDVMPYKWGKLMSNLGNATGAITNDNSSEARDITEAARNEAKQVLEAAGVRWLSEAEIIREWPDFGARATAAMNTPEQSSTWQSLGRQQGSVETEFLNGEIVRLAKTAGRSAPINEAINRIIQEMAVKKEKPGKYGTAQLRQILGLK
jgi:2-dehydropantoate 2-reductase